ncbi:flagellar basal body-associated FliL family protein [Sphingobium boeckii]|uniref:Flagellar protein FliL n=1 Tax=Sphingobium boeckii TaxID=1082345 RepID=A0A7W9AGM4_9SPHN|nr:flagellar basal body-associated FliL family protein [Sphingobium boeckii]MBB5685260.1 flagellar FliL protein [Sphingobium boeckii]
MANEMALEMEPEDTVSVPEEIQPQTRAKPKGRKLLWGGIAAVLLTGAAGGGYIFMTRDAENTAIAPENAVDAYVEVPPMTVNLRVPGGQARFLKLRFIIVAANAAQSETIRTKIPMLLDALQPFLRELRPEDLNGSAAVFRVKEEMMVRAHATFGSGMVRDILIQDLVQQ